MSGNTWTKLLVLYGLAAIAVPLIGYSLPPCLGDVEGQISPECMARWEAAMPPFPDRFVYLLGVPLSAAATFLLLAGATLVVDLAARLRRGKGGR